MTSELTLDTQNYIIVLNYKVSKDCIECIQKSFLSLSNKTKLILIDNNSPDLSIRDICNFLCENNIPFDLGDFSASNDSFLICKKNTDAKIMVIKSDKNLGYGGGINVGFKYLKYINVTNFNFLILNPDIIITDKMLLNLFQLYEKEDKTVISGITILKNKNKSIDYMGGFTINNFSGTVTPVKNHKMLKKLHYICGGSLLSNSVALNEIGMFPENYFLYWEETDWCTVAIGKGYTLKVYDKIVGINKGATSIGRGYLAEYYYSLNSLNYFKKFHPQYLFTIILSNMIRILYRLITYRWQRAKAIGIATLDFIFFKK